jgi:hypothetical protein
MPEYEKIAAAALMAIAALVSTMIEVGAACHLIALILALPGFA